MFDVITIGGATRDIFFRTKKGKIINGKEKLLAFEYGAKITPEKAYFSYGGGGANSAIAMARLGLKVSTYICLGKEGTGDIVLRNLKDSNVSVENVLRDNVLHTAFSAIISLPSGERVIFRYPGSDEGLKIDWLHFPKTSWIYLASLRGNSEKLIPKISNYVKKNDIKLAFNPGESQLEKGYKYLKNIFENTYILNLNLREAEELLEISKIKYKRNNMDSILKTIHNFGPKIVLITCGIDGAYVFDGEKKYFQKAIGKKPYDATGAGDAFGSSFVAGLILKYDIPRSLKIAAINSGSVVSNIGAQDGLLKMSQIKKIIRL